MNYFVLVRPFLALALLRGSPQNLPASGLLLGVSAFAYLIMSVGAYVLRFSIPVALAVSLAELAVATVLVGATLTLARRGARLLQTLTALIGTSAVMTFLSFPAYSWLNDAHEAGVSGPDHRLVAFLLLGWSMAVVTHIMRHALSCPPWVGLGVALGYTILSLSVMNHIMQGLGV